MILWNRYKIPKFGTFSHSGKTYTDCIITFDTETTSVFNVGGEWQAQDISKNPLIYTNADKRAFVYIWQLCIDGTVIYGRHIKEFFEFWDLFITINPNVNIIWVHNLGFDFEFLCEFIPLDTTVFAKSAYRPMTVKSAEMCVEFRCTYMLTNMSLDNCAKQFKLQVAKLKGNLIYNKVRTPLTTLTAEELAYCENDVLIIYQMIKDTFLPRYKNLADIPITQTGQVRREVKKIVKAQRYLMHELNKIKPDLQVYKLLTKVLAGGYTHNNPFYTDVILEGVPSFDKASSYPDVMSTRKYPMGKFVQCDTSHNDPNYCYIMRIECANIKACGAWAYIPRYKLNIAKGVVNDNGKVASADYLDMWVTDIDYNIIVNNYTIGNGGYIKIIDKYKAYSDYLPLPIVEYILKLYGDKTTLKGVTEASELYMRQKQLLNSVFGMTITNNVVEEQTFDTSTRQWQIAAPLTDSDIQEQLEKDRPFLNFAWGVWVTAHARSDLWEMIKAIGFDCIYCDTDSVKIINADKHRATIDQYNAKQIERIKKVCKDRNLKWELFAPVDIKGKEHIIGLFEYECTYDKFLTVGSKKYCYEIDGHFAFTVAGMRKTYLDNTGNIVPTMTDFKQMAHNNSVPNARQLHYHCAPSEGCDIIDCDGVPWHCDTHNGLCIQQCNYTFNVNDDEIMDYLFTATNYYRSPFRLYDRG